VDGYVRRRDFIKIAIAGSAAAWPLATRAEQPAALVGFLRSTRAEESGHLVAAVREGLRDSGYSSDKVIIETRWGDGREEELPKLARELIALPVAAIIAGSITAARAAKEATASIPIIFVTGGARGPSSRAADEVRSGRQPHDCKGARTSHPAIAACYRR